MRALRALYIADEVQTGLMRTGEMWVIVKAGIEPDIMVIGKGITVDVHRVRGRLRGVLGLAEGGRLRPFHGRRRGAGLRRRAEVLRDPARAEVRSMVHYIADRFGRGLQAIQELYPDGVRRRIRQDGVAVMGLEFDDIEGAEVGDEAFWYENGVWAIFSTLDPRVLQFKPGILLGPEPATQALTAPRSPSARRLSRRAASGSRRRPDEGDDARGCRRAARPDDAPAGPLGCRHGLRRVRSRAHAADRRCGRRGAYERAKVCRVGSRGNGHGRGRAQAAQERGLLEGRRERGRAISVSARVDEDARIVEIPRGRSGARADAVDQPDRDRVLQGPCLSLMTRNAVVVSPIPARPAGGSADAVHHLARAAVQAALMWRSDVEEPTIPLIEARWPIPTTM